MRKIRQPTTTRLVLEQLCAAPNDFMSLRMLMEATGRDYGAVHAALFNLRNYGAVDVVVNADGTGWWFATGNDQRKRVAYEIVPEIHRKRKPRKL